MHQKILTDICTKLGIGMKEEENKCVGTYMLFSLIVDEGSIFQNKLMYSKGTGHSVITVSLKKTYLVTSNGELLVQNSVRNCSL